MTIERTAKTRDFLEQFLQVALLAMRCSFIGPMKTERVLLKMTDKKPVPTFQDIIMNLQKYWGDYGCAILQPYDNEVGAGTFHTATTLRSLGPELWKCAYVQPSRRPTDGRYGENPNRLQHYYQYQVILKPSPDDVQELYLNSLRAIGIVVEDHDIRFVEDNWESPTLGA